jgi:hypothetical protein
VLSQTTANTAGAKPSCKKGDQVLRFTAESAYSGGALVVEAKRDSSYAVRMALEELDLHVATALPARVDYRRDPQNLTPSRERSAAH